MILPLHARRLHPAGVALWLALLLLGARAGGASGWLVPPSVEFDGRAFHVVARAEVPLPKRAILAQLRRLDALDRLSDAIQESRVLETSRAGTVVYLALKVRPWRVLCARFGQRQLVSIGDDHMDIRVEGQHNPFYGEAHWRFGETDGTTLIDFRARLEPRVEIPSIARGEAERFLREQAEQSIAALRRGALLDAPPAEDSEPRARTDASAYRLRPCRWLVY